MWYKAKIIARHLNFRERKWFFIFASVFAIGIISLSIIKFVKTTEAVPVAGGTWREGIVGQPTFINPVISGNNDADRDLISLLFCSATNIADKLESGDNHRDWRLRLKEDVLWHDGEPVTADDIIFTISKIQDPNNQSPFAASWQGVTVERVSELEVRFLLNTPFTFFKENLNKLYIVPEHIFADIPLANWRLSEYNLNPVGCGPYMFDSYRKQTDGFITNYTLIANPNYFDRPAFISKLELSFYTNYDNAIRDWNAGRLDGLGGLSPIAADTVRRSHNLYELATPRYYAIFINQNTHPGLKDKNVRLALDTAINKQALLDKILNGRGEILSGPITPNFLTSSSTSHAEDISEDNLKAASDILTNSGWTLSEDGRREKKISLLYETLEFDLLVPEVDLFVDTAHAVADAWNQIGVKTNVVILTPQQINSKIIPERNYQLLLFGNILGEQPDTFSFWHSSQITHPGLNLSLYSNSAADNLIENIRQISDPEELKTSLGSLQSLIAQDFPAIFLYSPNYLYLTATDLKGFSDKLIITPAHRLSDITNWYLKTSRQFKSNDSPDEIPDFSKNSNPTEIE